MIGKAGSANNRQRHTVGALSICVCTRVEFCSFSFLAIESVVAREVEKHAAGAHAIHRRRAAEAPATDRRTDGESDRNPYRSQPENGLTPENASRSAGPVRRGRWRVHMFVFWFNFLLAAAAEHLPQACSGARTDYTNRPCKKFKDTKGSCQTASARSPRPFSASASAAINGTNEMLLRCFPICLSDLRLVLYIDHVRNLISNI
jgi:hypothetical protein